MVLKSLKSDSLILMGSLQSDCFFYIHSSMGGVEAKPEEEFPLVVFCCTDRQRICGTDLKFITL